MNILHMDFLMAHDVHYCMDKKIYRCMLNQERETTEYTRDLQNAEFVSNDQKKTLFRW